MVTLLLSVLPVLCVATAFVYAVVVGGALLRTSGFVSALAVAATLAGLALGRLLDRFVALPRELDDWVNYRGGVDPQISMRGERFLAILSVESAALFILASCAAILAVWLVKRDAEGRTRSETPPRRMAPLAALFVLAVAITARSKLAVCVAFALAKAHLL
jgi:MFS family permease